MAYWFRPVFLSGIWSPLMICGYDIKRNKVSFPSSICVWRNYGYQYNLFQGLYDLNNSGLRILNRQDQCF